MQKLAECRHKGRTESVDEQAEPDSSGPAAVEAQQLFPSSVTKLRIFTLNQKKCNNTLKFHFFLPQMRSEGLDRRGIKPYIKIEQYFYFWWGGFVLLWFLHAATSNWRRKTPSQEDGAQCTEWCLSLDAEMNIKMLFEISQVLDLGTTFKYILSCMVTQTTEMYTFLL